MKTSGQYGHLMIAVGVRPAEVSVRMVGELDHASVLESCRVAKQDEIIVKIEIDEV